MNDAAVMDIAMQAMIITLKLATPILAVSLGIGVAISLLQSVTQVQEFTLTFVPKLAGIALVIVITGGWMLHELVSFTEELFDRLPALLG